jgi:5-methylcytosine-specific restriction endonuclease McrA
MAHARRREAERNGNSDIHWHTLGPRDSWRCHLCGGKVPKVGGTAKQPKGATVDHLEPISEGGPHVWSNVKLAHRSCNISRQAGGTVQLLLVG